MEENPGLTADQILVSEGSISPLRSVLSCTTAGKLFNLEELTVNGWHSLCFILLLLLLLSFIIITIIYYDYYYHYYHQ